MTTYAFKQLHTGPRWEVIKTGFTRRSQAEAFARDYLRERNEQIIALDHDAPAYAIDIMTVRHGVAFQYAIERE